MAVITGRMLYDRIEQLEAENAALKEQLAEEIRISNERGEKIEQLLADLSHSATDLVAAQKVPEGMVMVPREPTDAMAVAAIKASLGSPAINGVGVYRAMIAAAEKEPRK